MLVRGERADLVGPHPFQAPGVAVLLKELAQGNVVARVEVEFVRFQKRFGFGGEARSGST